MKHSALPFTGLILFSAALAAESVSPEHTKEVQQRTQQVTLHEWFDARMQEHDNTVISEHSQHHKTPAE
jgi:hypothetical protein